MSCTACSMRYTVHAATFRKLHHIFYKYGVFSQNMRKIVVLLIIALLLVPLGYSVPNMNAAQDEAYGVAVDPDGNVVVVGQHQSGDKFVIRVQKYNGDTGVILWQTDFDEFSQNIGKAVVTDAGGNIYVGGMVGSGLGDLVPSTDYVIVKYDSNGNKLIRKTYDEGFADFLMDMDVDSSGYIYATGMVLRFSASSELSDVDFWTIKVNPDNLAIVDSHVYDNNIDAAFGLDVRGSTVAVAGATQSDDISQYCLVKYDTGLNQQWGGAAKFYPTSAPPNNASGSDAVILSTGDIAITGNVEDDFLTVLYDSSGNVKTGWPKTVAGDKKDDALSIACDASDNIIVGGYRTENNQRKWYAVKYTSGGTEVWKKFITDGDGDKINGEIKRVAVDDHNNIIMAGFRMDGADEHYCIIKCSASGDFIWEASSENPPPPTTADFHWIPQQPTRASNIHFIDDSTGDILSWHWDFGDGTTSTEQNPWHQYTALGTFNVTLTIQTSAGEAHISKDVTVTNAPPSAAFTYQPPNPLEGDDITFDASGSTDPDGTIVNYAWDFGDGTQGSGVTVTHTYTTNGTYTVKLTVTDNDGATKTKTGTITVNPPTGHLPPIPSFTVSDESPAVGETVSFDASASYDPDGSIIFYRWDWNGDGTYDNEYTQPTATHSFLSEGTYNITLQVEDNQSMTNTYTMEISVGQSGGDTPIVLIAVTKVSVNKNEEKTIDVKVKSPVALTGVHIVVTEKTGNITVDTGGSVNLTPDEEQVIPVTVTASEDGTITIKAVGDGGESDTKEITVALKSGGGTPSFTLFLLCVAMALMFLYFRRRHE